METENASLILECLHKFIDCRNKVTTDKYETAITEVCEYLQLRIDELPNSSKNQTQSESDNEKLASSFQAGLTAELDALKKREKSLKSEEYRIVLAIFVVPALQKVLGEPGIYLSEKLREVWIEINPELPFTVSSFDKLTSGFQKKPFKGCFITSAVCRSENKPDDCEELTAFRNFRDSWLCKQEDGKELIEEYYIVAPEIVKKIDSEPNSTEIYESIRLRYLEDCYDLLKKDRKQECKNLYISMVNDLKSKYLPQ